MSKRKDTYKNRNKPGGQSWPQSLRFFKEKQHSVIGATCGRCGAKKGAKSKCPNRSTPDTLPKLMEDYLKVLPKNFTAYFCILKREVFV